MLEASGSSTIPQFERAPVTDAEWALALVDYALDRDVTKSCPNMLDSYRPSTNPFAYTSKFPAPVAEQSTSVSPFPAESRPVHPPLQTMRSSSSRLTHSAEFIVDGDDPTMRFREANKRHTPDGGPSTSESIAEEPNPFGFSSSRPESPESLVYESQFGETRRGSAVLENSHAQWPPKLPVDDSSQPVRASLLDRTGSGSDQRKPRSSVAPMIYNIATAMRLPTHGGGDDGDDRTGDEERARLRHLYETEGWLHGAAPSKTTTLKRKKAIRTLGLVEDDADEPERVSVMRKYAELAKQIFQTKYSMVTVFRGKEQHSYFAETPSNLGDDPHWQGSADATATAHALVRGAEEWVFLVADASKDWRFRNMPIRKATGNKFYAVAPLIYTSNDDKITFGTISVYDIHPRDAFDRRERDILLNLANMLVYQLSTLQSEIMAKRYGSMYEQSIAFLRRSTLPEHLKGPSQKKREKKQKPKKLESGPRRASVADVLNSARRQSLAESINASRRQSVAEGLSGFRRESQATTLSMSTSQALEAVEVAVKTGPNDSKRTKKWAMEMDQALFTDSAATLRKVLGADAVATVAMDEYQLFIRKTGPTAADPRRGKGQSNMKLQIIEDFLQGKEWPADVDPVVQYVPRSFESQVTVLGRDGDDDLQFHFDQPGAQSTLADYLSVYLKTRKFWWDREDPDDDLTHRIMALMPDQAQTTLATAFMLYNGSVKYIAFATWRKPPSQFAESSTMALPFTWIMGGVTMAALAIRKVRSQEQSHITYSNLQAHELRTPLHQILAITQLLRSGMNDLANTPQDVMQDSLTTTQQLRDFLPFLDAIDTSGKILHGIVDNILSFLDLKAKEDMIAPGKSALLSSPTGAAQSIERMFEELIHEATEEDHQSRTTSGRAICYTETVFEIIPTFLGEEVTEDAGGALRKALSKILSNAYKFIDGQEGCVSIYVDDVLGLMPPEGYEDLSSQKRISIKIIDNGHGMDAAFVRDKLGEPWAKEDPYATGSGLSVHLAYSIIDLMGGEMQITSSVGGGCTVELEVDVPRRAASLPGSPNMTKTEAPESSHDPAHLAVGPDEFNLGRKISLAGFNGSDRLIRLGETIGRQYKKLGCQIVPLEEAELVIADGWLEEQEQGREMLEQSRTDDIVFLVTPDHEASQSIVDLEQSLNKAVRRFRKPATPSILREALFPNHSDSITAEILQASGVKHMSINLPDEMDQHGQEITHDAKPRAKFDEATLSKANNPTSSFLQRGFGTIWKPKGMPVEDAVACLCLGDYFSSRRRGPSGSGGGTPASSAHEHESTDDTPNAIGSEFSGLTSPHDTTYLTPSSESEPEPEPEPEMIKVLVVEDNMVNRKILVKILSTKLGVEVHEAEDGHAAVELFKDFSHPVIVLLDINMPRMDGYQACAEMRAIEKELESKGKSQIIAVTALSSEAARRRGLVESGFDQWHTKPCGRAAIQKMVTDARDLLLSQPKSPEVS
ncbi:hypothetical protein BCR39DRAFT_600069 [Naematelia encephala]|uniref:histidine kinase n=1 Tax=Naematelia encephala TaxID=71784 RepID=A0A1Y2AT20_9TREE|nr:hypothetical protein BCR39DRAFT_600069 [Naematelia encephala]